MEIIPGILEKDWEEIERKIQLVSQFSPAIHIDLIDDSFGSPTFNDPAPFKKFSQTNFLELHMMVSEPINYLEKWADAGFKRFIGHVEHMSDQEEFVAQGQLLGEVGLGLDLITPKDKITITLSDLDLLLVMTVKAGSSGQNFEESALEKIKEFKDADKFLKIQIDGGVNEQTIIDAKNAGAERFVTTSYIFRSEDPKAQLGKLRGLVSG